MPTQDPNDPGLLLDPTSDVTEQLGGPVVLSELTAHQQVAYDEWTGDLYVTQVIQGGRQFPDEPEPLTFTQRRRRGDLAINHLAPDGTPLGLMYVRRFDHGGALGAEREPYSGELLLWTGYDAPEVTSGNAHGTKVARYPFTDGTVLDVGAPGIEVFDPVPDGVDVIPGLDTANNQVAIRYNRGTGFRYQLYDYPDFVAGRFDTFRSDFPQLPRDQVPKAPVFQSWTLWRNYIYEHRGFAYGPSNPPPGDAHFVIMDAVRGDMVRVAANLHHTELERREPEAITVRNTPDGPELVFGFSLSEITPRQMNLYATEPAAGPGLFITAQTVQDGIALTVSLEETESIRQWAVIRQPGGIVLFSGSGDDVTTNPMRMLDTGPPECRPVTYVLRVEYEDRPARSETSQSVTYIPPGGCTGSSQAVTESIATLGCPSSYTVRVHWRGGALTLPLEMTDRLTDVTWNRTLNEVSEAVAVFSRTGMSEDCCREVTGIHPWVHELTVYRDSDIVWQGPIQKIRVLRDSITIEASDVFAWLDVLGNTFQINYTTAAPDARGRRRGTIVYIAANHLRLNMVESSLSVPPDYAQIMDYVVAREDGLPTIKVEKDGSRDDRAWTEFLGNIFREWQKRGLTWTTVGRSLLLRGTLGEQSLPMARLSTDDFLGDVEIIRDGTEAATYAFATTQQGRDISGEGTDDDFIPSKTVGTGRTGTAYGRIDRIVQIDEDEADDQDLLDAARNELKGRFPAPMLISMPVNAQVSPEAPVTMRQLVPGERIDVFSKGCFDIAQGFTLTDVEAAWVSGREEISIGLTPLLDALETPPSQEQATTLRITPVRTSGQEQL